MKKIIEIGYKFLYLQDKIKTPKQIMHYKYCGICGKELVDHPAGDDGMVPYCEKCQMYWFDSFSSCVIIMVVNEYDEIAMLKQSYLSTEHETFVSGYIKPGENAETAAIREVNEELGLSIEHLEYAGTYWFPSKELLMLGYIGNVKKTVFHLSSEVDSASWVSIEEAESHMFPERPGNTQHKIFRRWINGKK